MPPKGATFIGRWTAADLTGGFALLESDDVGALTEYATMWTDLIELKLVPVIEGAALVEALGRAGK
jgi:hypothetical protein